MTRRTASRSSSGTDLDGLPDGVAVGADDHGAPHGPVVRELGGGDHIGVPRVEVHRPRRHLPLPVPPAAGLRRRGRRRPVVAAAAWLREADTLAAVPARHRRRSSADGLAAAADGLSSEGRRSSDAIRGEKRRLAGLAVAATSAKAIALVGLAKMGQVLDHMGPFPASAHFYAVFQFRPTRKVCGNLVPGTYVRDSRHRQRGRSRCSAATWRRPFATFSILPFFFLQSYEKNCYI